jgi:3-hydroxyacyl-CoA dehydrogenase/3a,7a,12a-trihydroxy-5b-cholest-24-enoyl-CoA hydratase
VNTTYLFKLKNPASEWTVDLKGKGSVAQGAQGKAECTLELTDADFLAMCTGQADPQKLFTTGKLKIAGNVMASQKLNFLKNIDPKLVQGGAPAASAAPVASSGPSSAAIFAALGAYVAENADLAGKVNTTYLFKLKDPASQWTLDLKGKGSVVEGAQGKADCTLELTDADFLAMCTGQADPQKLFTTGKLKIAGNVMASQKLNFLKNLDPKKVAAAAAKAPAAQTPSSSSSAPQAAAIFEKLGSKLGAKLVGEVGAVLQFKVREPEAAYVVDLKSGNGAVRAGSDAAAGATFELSDEDLAALSKGEASARDLYQHGKLKVQGDVRLAHKLDFMKLN